MHNRTIPILSDIELGFNDLFLNIQKKDQMQL
jgi:hypothetical protein